MNRSYDNLIRIGLIGAGAIAQQAYFPLLRIFRGLEITAVVESNENIRSKMAASHPPFIYLGADLDAAMDHVDAVIICVPNYLHYHIAQTCLAKGKHVLCEKPVTIDVIDAETLMGMAEDRSLTLTVAHVRRFFPAVKKIKEIITTGLLGAITDFDFREGTVFSWPTVSGYIFDKEKAGGGVLMDIGVHLLDLLLWWLDDEPVRVVYEDDALGGLEAFADIHMTFSKGVTGRVRLSRLSVLRNSYSLRFERGEVQWSPFHPGSLYIRKEQKKPQILAFRDENPILTMLSDFRDAIMNKRKPLVTLEEALLSLKVIDNCYRTRKSLALDWLVQEKSHDNSKH